MATMARMIASSLGSAPMSRTKELSILMESTGSDLR